MLRQYNQPEGILSQFSDEGLLSSYDRLFPMQRKEQKEEFQQESA